jgi:hypothetical protein
MRNPPRSVGENERGGAYATRDLNWPPYDNDERLLSVSRDLCLLGARFGTFLLRGPLVSNNNSKQCPLWVFLETLEGVAIYNNHPRRMS